MSDRAFCPACNSESSTILAGFRDLGECPNCGLSVTVVEALTAAAKRGADEQLIERTAKAEQRAEAAERELAKLRHALRKIAALIPREGA